MKLQVVYDNFEEIVMKSNADVMLEIYAPWCGHCKAGASCGWQAVIQKVFSASGACWIVLRSLTSFY